jgi:hypothetical protein
MPLHRQRLHDCTDLTCWSTWFACGIFIKLSTLVFYEKSNRQLTMNFVASGVSIARPPNHACDFRSSARRGVTAASRRRLIIELCCSFRSAKAVSFYKTKHFCVLFFNLFGSLPLNIELQKTVCCSSHTAKAVSFYKTKHFCVLFCNLFGSLPLNIELQKTVCCSFRTAKAAQSGQGERTVFYRVRTHFAPPAPPGPQHSLFSNRTAMCLSWTKPDFEPNVLF